MTDNSNIRLVLASQSPRRVELLRLLGLTFDIVPSNVDEVVTEQDPQDVVKDLAKQKAEAVVSQLSPDDRRTIVLAADTIVVIGREVLGKPSTREHAYQMLVRLSGRAHKVYTGVALIDTSTNEMLLEYEETDVHFRPLDSSEIRAYARTPEPMDKAGAYALQGTASAFVDRIDGCYTNVIGLPVPLTVKMLRRLGMHVLGLP